MSCLVGRQPRSSWADAAFRLFAGGNMLSRSLGQGEGFRGAAQWAAEAALQPAAQRGERPSSFQLGPGEADQGEDPRAETSYANARQRETLRRDSDTVADEEIRFVA